MDTQLKALEEEMSHNPDVIEQYSSLLEQF
jgi:hypothetical protein